MATAAWIDDLLQPDRELRDAGNGLLSALAPGASDTPYDQHAAVYDHLIGYRLYNRMVWGTSPAAYAYAAFASPRSPTVTGRCWTWAAAAPCSPPMSTALPRARWFSSTAPWACSPARLGGCTSNRRIGRR